MDTKNHTEVQRVRIEIKLLKQAQARAKQESRTVASVIRQALSEFLSKERQDSEIYGALGTGAGITSTTP